MLITPSNNRQMLVTSRSFIVCRGSTNNYGILRSSHFPKQCSSVASVFGGGADVQLWLPYCHLNLQTGSHASFRQTPYRLPTELRVKHEDSEETTLSNESTTLDEKTLKKDLQIAIEEENYAQAAKIRDSLRVLYEDSKASVLSTNARFYDSFRNGDLAGMQVLWPKGENVCCVHPGVSGITGYDNVIESWEVVWADYEFPLRIELKDVEVHVRGDIGYVTCVEMVRTKGSSWGRQFATNVFERIDGQWFICIHHASQVDL